MDEKSSAVLAAADAWLTAMRAVRAVDEHQRPSDAEQETFDTAEVELAVAVMVWQESRQS